MEDNLRHGWRETAKRVREREGDKMDYSRKV